MIPWSLLGAATIPGGGELRLLRRGAEFSIRLGTAELMNSRLRGSEEALATMTCERIRDIRAPTILIGGLGMGFTLRAALGALGPQARIVVAELLPAVVAWARGEMAEIFEGSLEDPRIVIREDDVGRLLHGHRLAYDAILLDVDNGPEAFTVPANDRLYEAAGLGAAHDALRPGGILAVWSAAPDRHFADRLRRTGFQVEEVRVRADGRGGGSRHVLWFATRSDGPAAGRVGTPRRR